MPEITQHGRLLKFRGPLDDDVLLIDSLNGHEGISQPYRFDLELLADVQTGQDQQVIPDKLVGQDVSVEIELPGDAKRYLNGVIQSFIKKERRERFAVYQAEVVS